MQSDYPTEPMQSAQPAEPVQPAQPMQPAQPVQPVQPVRPAQPVRPIQSTTGQASGPSTYRAAQIVYTTLGVIEALLIIRLILKLLAANPSAGFSSLIYAVTGPLVAPFQGVFPEAQSGGSVLEVSALLAILIYALLAWAIVQVVLIVAGRREPPGTA